MNKAELIERLSNIVSECSEQFDEHLKQRLLIEAHDAGIWSEAIGHALELVEQLTEPQWVSVDEHLPPRNELVLVTQELVGRCLRSLGDDGCWRDENEIFDDSGLEINHWMLLPEAPE